MQKRGFPDKKRSVFGGAGGASHAHYSQTAQITLQHQGAVPAVAFSSDGKTVLTGNTDKAARFWEYATGKPIWTKLLCVREGKVMAVAFSPDGQGPS